MGRPAAEEWPELDTLLQREGLNLRIDSLVNGTDGDRAHVAVKPLSELILPLRGWPEAQAMLAAMLVPNPEKRITAVDALRLPFFAPCRERAWAAGRDPFSVRCIDAGGAGSAVSELLANESLMVPVMHLGLPDKLVDHASHQQQLSLVGLDCQQIIDRIQQRVDRL